MGTRHNQATATPIAVTLMVTLIAVILASLNVAASPEPDCGPGSQDPRCMRAYTKMIESKTSSGDKRAAAHLLRGLAYLGKRQHELAMRDFTAIIDFGPDNEHSFYSEARVQRGLIYYAQKKNDKAITDFTAAIEVDPKRWKAYKFRAYAHDEKRNIKKAFEDATMAIELREDDIDTLVLRGAIFTKLNRTTYAEADFRRALSLNPPTEQARDIERLLEALSVMP